MKLRPHSASVHPFLSCPLLFRGLVLLWRTVQISMRSYLRDIVTFIVVPVIRGRMMTLTFPTARSRLLRNSIVLLFDNPFFVLWHNRPSRAARPFLLNFRNDIRKRQLWNTSGNASLVYIQGK